MTEFATEIQFFFDWKILFLEKASDQRSVVGGTANFPIASFHPKEGVCRILSINAIEKV